MAVLLLSPSWGAGLAALVGGRAAGVGARINRHIPWAQEKRPPARYYRTPISGSKPHRWLLLIDEPAFHLLPGVVTTWAPAGETPVLRCRLTRDHLSVISAISPEGKLYLTMQDTAFDSDAVVILLKRLLQEIPGKLLIIWDGAPIHRSKTIQ